MRQYVARPGQECKSELIVRAGNAELACIRGEVQETGPRVVEQETGPRVVVQENGPLVVVKKWPAAAGCGNMYTLCAVVM